MNEFYKLVQGSMTVDAYEKKVTELSRAAPHIVENEVNRCRKFEEGLKHEIKTYISAAEHTEYGKLKRSNQNWSVGGSSNKIPRVESYSRPTTSFQQTYVPDSSQASVKQPMGGSQQSGSVGRVRYPPCQKCGKNHKGRCNLDWTLKRDCPGLAQRSNVEQLQVPQNVSSSSVQMKAPRVVQKTGSTIV
ncbi:hypothetical protein ACOSQ3_027558 [Xanthoceras sorbifolium]